MNMTKKATKGSLRIEAKNSEYVAKYFFANFYKISN